MHFRFVTKVIKHITDWSRINKINIILCNASQHQATTQDH